LNRASKLNKNFYETKNKLIVNTKKPSNITVDENDVDDIYNTNSID
jgi:hypothetical protein